MKNFTLSFEAADFEKKLATIGNHLVVGYAVSDPNCENPMDFDYFGKIVKKNNSSDRDIIREIQVEDSYGDVDIGILSDYFGFNLDDFEIVDLGLPSDNLGSKNPDSSKESLCDILSKEALEKVVEEGCFEEDDLQKIKQHLVDAGKIGIPGAVPLDLYEHSLQRWSVSYPGNKTVCFDTSRCAAYWIPDEGEMDEYIKRVSLLRLLGKTEGNTITFTESDLTKGLIEKYGLKVEDPHLLAKIRLEVSENESIGSHFSEKEKLDAYREECYEWAASATDTYSDYVNGNTYGYVIEVFENLSFDPELPQWEEVDSMLESLWGFFGTSFIDSDLNSAFETVTSKVANIYSEFSSPVIAKVFRGLEECSSPHDTDKVISYLGSELSNLAFSDSSPTSKEMDLIASKVRKILSDVDLAVANTHKNMIAGTLNLTRFETLAVDDFAIINPKTIVLYADKYWVADDFLKTLNGIDPQLSRFIEVVKSAKSAAIESGASFSS